MAKPLSVVPPPPPPGPASGLGAKVEATIERVIAWLVNTAGEGFSSITRAALELFFEAIAGILAPYAAHMHDEIMSNPGVPDYVKASLKRPSAGTDVSDGMMSIIYIVTAVIGGWLGINRPSSRLSEQVVDRVLVSARPDPSAAWPMAWRTGNESGMRSHMLDLGWHATLQDAWRDAIRPRPNAVDLFRASFRESISIEQARAELAAQGWEASDIATLESLAQQLPGPGDLITMAVRGAFSPDEIGQFNLGAEFPSVFAEWMVKQGFDQEWAERYWYAHWQLPSITAGYEMLHRRIIDGSTLDLLLKAQDISPFWRDKLKDMSYNPLTRVDVRRMYGMGVLDEQAVYNAYLDIGYNETNAQLMTEFTVMYETDEPRSLTKADVLRGVRDGMLTASEAASWLVEAGYPSSLAEFYVAREQAAVARDFADRRAKVVGEQFIHHELTEPQARTQLTALGFSASEIDLRIDDWLIDRQARVGRPTQAQVSRFFRDDIISQSELEQMLGALGYPDQYVDWYVSSALAQKAEDALRAEQEALDEAQKLRESRIKTAYQVEKAELDLSIAQVRTAITDLQVALRARTMRYQSERRVAVELPTEVQVRQQAAADIEALEAQMNAQREAVAYLEQQVEQRESVIAELELDLAQARVGIAPAVEQRQASIDELRAVVRGHQLAIERLQISIAEAQAARGALVADVEAQRQAIADLEGQVVAYREAIDQLQTGVADRNLAIAQIAEQLAIALASGVTDEQEADLKEAANLDTLQLKTEIAELEVEIESIEDEIASVRVEIEQGQEQVRVLGDAVAADVQVYDDAIAGYRVEIEREQESIAESNERVAVLQGEINEIEAPTRRVTTSVHESRLVIERAQDDIKEAGVTMAQLRTAIADRRSRMRQDLALVERVVTVAQLDADYETDRAGVEQQLGERRATLSALLEEKATLQVKYRQDLSVE